MLRSLLQKEMVQVFLVGCVLAGMVVYGMSLSYYFQP